jgi:hypothetical protein|tara:strand:- start:986 stop:1474 length:489 start_codon:yes stop_codon:yes gene_type:complete
MPYTVTFLDDKLRQSLSFDADMQFPEASEYTKKVWVLKEYRKAGGDLDLSERSSDLVFEKTHSSYSLHKSFQGDELVVELVQSIKFFDDFDYFSEAEIEVTGEEELDDLLNQIKASEFKMEKIAEIFGLSDKMPKLADFKQPSPEEEECTSDCEEDCDCDSK